MRESERERLRERHTRVHVLVGCEGALITAVASKHVASDVNGREGRRRNHVLLIHWGDQGSEGYQG